MLPIFSPEEELTARDFIIFQLLFARAALYFVEAREVDFIPVSSAEESDLDLPSLWREGHMAVVDSGAPVVVTEGALLFLPLFCKGRQVCTAVFTPLPGNSFAGCSEEWLQERSCFIARECENIKKWAFDGESALLNGQSLREEMAILVDMLQEGGVDERDAARWTLFVLEVSPQARKGGQAGSGTARAASCLKAFFGEMVGVHHLGAGLFGLLWYSADDSEFPKKMAYALLGKLKRYGLAGVHVGLVSLDRAVDGGADALLAAAWQAVKEAAGSGPFAISSGGGGEPAELSPPSSRTLARLASLWRGVGEFTVALVRSDLPGTDFSKRIYSLAGENGELLVEAPGEAYLFLRGVSGDAALSRLRSFKKRLTSVDISSVSVGLASFPCSGVRRKLDVALNSRKALHHASLLGPGSLVVFDGVSLNISGDLYYNGGNLNRAVREYRHGLLLDPDNINLLNSLAVIYAQVNRYGKAIPLFEQVLSLDERDFMALYNLGFAWLNRGDTDAALDYLERALEVDGEYYDLLLQLGRIYCQLGRYGEACELLERALKLGTAENRAAVDRPWCRCELPERAGDSIGDDLINRYLARAYQGLGRLPEAVRYLQKAISYDPRDADSLSRLGELYFLEGQGDDIALSCCQQAVDLDAESAGNWRRLALVQQRLGGGEDILESLRRCLALEPKDLEALLMLAEAHEKMAQKSKARKLYKRVLRIDKNNKKALKAMRRR